MRQSLEADVLKAKTELRAQIDENRSLMNNYEEKLVNCDSELKEVNEEMKKMEAYLNSQK